MTATPDSRVRACNSEPLREDGDYVLYWMIAFRRLGWNFALERAVEQARRLGKPLVILEPLRCGYRWANDRIHRFVLEGMAGHAARLAKGNVLYYPYVEPKPGAGKGLLEALGKRACLIVTDDYPAFFLPRMIAAAASKVRVRMEAVDSNGLLPLRAAEKDFVTAYHFRRFLQKVLPEHLEHCPAENPLAGKLPPRLKALPEEITRRWPPASPEMLGGGSLAKLPIDHSVPPVPDVRGGDEAGERTLERFLEERLERYAEGRNDPAEEVTSALSPYLHFGYVSAHQAFAALMARERWSPERLARNSRGAKEGWWGMSPEAEKFLDEAITWREVGYNMASHREDFERYESLPEWARKTLQKHERDPRPEVYSPEEFEAGRTHDEIWNAAQGQLAAEGRIHNYLRMLWGKKVLHWSSSPREALATLIDLNNKYALDGRDPNSYSGIFWCFGRYDRPWAPERPVFGTVRYMSSESTRRKFRVNRYVERYVPKAGQKSLFET
ncbi:MAG TPA: deoxyribodipyrimidine photolyase [Thermoanaerobaculia bacterium]|nr:deoxyribodipyrimidine photolyase [Thermoanaerobaculia bacterium]